MIGYARRQSERRENDRGREAGGKDGAHRLLLAPPLELFFFFLPSSESSSLRPVLLASRLRVEERASVRAQGRRAKKAGQLTSSRHSSSPWTRARPSSRPRRPPPRSPRRRSRPRRSPSPRPKTRTTTRPRPTRPRIRTQSLTHPKLRPTRCASEIEQSQHEELGGREERREERGTNVAVAAEELPTALNEEGVGILVNRLHDGRPRQVDGALRDGNVDRASRQATKSALKDGPRA